MKAIRNFSKYLQFVSSRGIIEFDEFTDFDVNIQKLYKAISKSFPSKPEKVNNVDKYIFRSTSSDLVVVPSRAILNVEYFGNYIQDYDLCERYTKQKLLSTFRGIVNVLKKPIRFLAMITHAKISFNGLNIETISFITDRFVKVNQKRNKIVDLALRFAYVHDEKYFVNYQISSYWTRGLSQKVKEAKDLPMVGLHELQLIDEGIKIIHDVNTKYDAFRQLSDYSDQDFEDFLKVAKESQMNIPSQFLKGEI